MLKLFISLPKKEFLEIIYAINKFIHYINGYEFFVRIDDSSITYLMNKPITNGRITSWLLLLHEFNIIVLHRSGRENQVSNFLSRINTPSDTTPIKDNFLDENLFAISFKSTWFVDIANYLSTRKLPPYFSPKEKQRIITQSAKCLWI